MSFSLPKIKNIKSFISLFKYNIKLINKYKITIINFNKIRIHILNVKKHNNLTITLFFDSEDNVITLLDCDDINYYKSDFYKEVILKQKDNDAWNIIKKRYNKNEWIEKYIYFILNAPNKIEKLIYDI